MPGSTGGARCATVRRAPTTPPMTVMNTMEDVWKDAWRRTRKGQFVPGAIGVKARDLWSRRKRSGIFGALSAMIEKAAP